MAHHLVVAADEVAKPAVGEVAKPAAKLSESQSLDQDSDHRPQRRHA